MTNDIGIQKPKKLSLAINLFIVSIVLGIINSIISEMTTEIKNYTSAIGLTTTIFTLALVVFFVYQMSAGKKWARTTFLVLSILGALFLPFTIFALLKANPIVGIISIISTILQIIAFIMIYNKECKEWFR
jgi:lipid-A-disaccharide synthase-like uncharacterized protein